LHTARPTPDSFGVALLLAREAGANPLAWIGFDAIDAASVDAVTPMTDPALESCRNAIPAARCLPILEAIATGGSSSADRTVVLDAANRTRVFLRVHVVPAALNRTERQSACA
jgi:hypothetical protein